MKKLHYVTRPVLLVLALFLLGAASFAQSEPVTVTWWTEDYIDLDQITATLIEPFQAAHPDIQLVITPQPELNTTLRTALAAGEAPDILQTPGASFIAEFLNSGLILSLSNAADTYGWEDKLLPWAYQSGIVDGELYSIPLTYESMILLYNKTVFEENGWEPPTNLAEFEAIAEAAVAAGINPLSYGNVGWQPTNEHLVGIYLNNYAGPENVYQALIGEKSWTDPEFAEAIQLLKTHIADNGWFSGSLETYFSFAWEDMFSEFSNGGSAMMMIGSWGFRGATEFFAETDYDWDWAPLPVFSDMAGEYNYELATGSTLSVNGETDHPEAVLTVLDWLMSDPARVLEIASGYGYGEFMIPLYFTAEDFPASADERIVRFFSDFAAVTGEGRVGYTTWTFWPAAPNVQLWEAIENVWYDELSIDDYLAEQQALWEEARNNGEVLPIPAR
ncbi:MAG: extracellular solute-binding protein [Anaerolineae bacterium]|nr:extracellular solute-binding protein [Anaerolineae bacterium]MCA9892171.1 extracellular solute-binding protein [Anaerolineae bacterium]MCB9460264.1 extracellular solute-binding protein [Anaerolineaceae bacterium]